MSIRIHELAKKIGMDNKQLLSLLKERKYDVKSVSSTIDNISAEAIEQEFAAQAKSTATAIEPEPEPSSDDVSVPDVTTDEPVASSSPKPIVENEVQQAFTTKLPAGMMVKSAQDIAREKEEAAKASAKPPAVVMPPRPSAPSMPGRPAMPMTPASRPTGAPPPTQPVVSSPRPAPTPYSSPRPVSSPQPAPVVSPQAPRPTVANAPQQPPAYTPPPVKTPPSAPVPVSAPPNAPKLPPVVSAPAAVPALPTSGGTTPPIVSIEGDVKIIHLKPPIVVRDFATALGLKPFKLISELMEMGIFASMNQNIEEGVATKVAEKHGFLLEIKHRGDAAAQQAIRTRNLIQLAAHTG